VVNLLNKNTGLLTSGLGKDSVNVSRLSFS